MEGRLCSIAVRRKGVQATAQPSHLSLLTGHCMLPQPKKRCCKQAMEVCSWFPWGS